MALHNEIWFPSVIWSGVIPPQPNTELTDFIYDKRKSDPGVKISNCNGWQSSEIVKGECDQIDYLVSVFDKEIAFCVEQTGLPDLEINNIWINVNPPGAYNQLHNHQGSVLSGVYYVQAEEGQGNIQFERNDDAEYFLPLNNKKQTYFNCTRATYKAKSNALYIFPGWLKHSVESNKTGTDRISISFNYGVKTDAS